MDKRIYIIGAGFAGQTIADDIKRKKIFGKVNAFIDDNKDLIGTTIDGVPVLGPISGVTSILSNSDLDEAIIAIPSAPTERIREIYETLTKNGFSHIKILPGISQVVTGTAHLVQTREIDPLDILGRTPVTISLKESLAYLRGKRVLITGAGGSIGSELARQLLSGGAERLYLFGHGENSICQIYRELRLLQSEGVGEKATIVPIIGDMRDREYVDFIIKNTKCNVIFHCAAYKHVPMMEENQVAAIENNVFGTKNLLDAALAHKVSRFVLISTDKAVAPVSVYGVSKMICEKLVLDAAKKAEKNATRADENVAGKKNDTRGGQISGAAKISDTSQAIMFVRFGNVLGSRGSILPLFQNQIKTGGPITVTDENMVRFFMTIPEACSLVLQAGGVGENGKSYLLDMGEPIKIIDLAKQIIKFSGLEPYKDIDIKIVGARKGERLVEPLWLEEENPTPTKYKKLLTLDNKEYDSQRLNDLLSKLEPICFYTKGKEADFRNRDKLVNILCDDCKSLKDFYEEIKNDNQKRTDLL